MKHTKESFAAYKKAATIGNDKPLLVVGSVKKEIHQSTARTSLEAAANYRRNPRGVASIEKVQAKIWGGR